MLKVILGIWPLAPKRYESNLSTEVLYILVGQEAAKILEVKVGGGKENSNLMRPGPAEPEDFLSTSNFDL